jgi:hypothetical protein
MRSNLNPKYWGPEGWAFLKSCARACDEESFPHYAALVKLLPHVLPCEKCRHHAEEYIQRNPPQSAQELLSWIEDFERAVRQRKSKEDEADGHPSRELWLAYAGLGFAVALLVLCCTVALLCAARRSLTRP